MNVKAIGNWNVAKRTPFYLGFRSTLLQFVYWSSIYNWTLVVVESMALYTGCNALNLFQSIIPNFKGVSTIKTFLTKPGRSGFSFSSPEFKEYPALKNNDLLLWKY